MTSSHSPDVRPREYFGRRFLLSGGTLFGGFPFNSGKAYLRLYLATVQNSVKIRLFSFRDTF